MIKVNNALVMAAPASRNCDNRRIGTLRRPVAGPDGIYTPLFDEPRPRRSFGALITETVESAREAGWCGGASLQSQSPALSDYGWLPGMPSPIPESDSSSNLGQTDRRGLCSAPCTRR